MQGPKDKDHVCLVYINFPEPDLVFGNIIGAQEIFRKNKIMCVS